MARIASFLLVLGALQSLTFGRIASHLKDGIVIPDEDKETVDFWMGGLTGLWTGFYKGFYNNGRQVSDKCFGDESRDELYQILYFIGYGEFSDIFKTADAAASLFTDNLLYCNF